jgi:hypothetical protein
LPQQPATTPPREGAASHRSLRPWGAADLGSAALETEHQHRRGSGPRSRRLERLAYPDRRPTQHRRGSGPRSKSRSARRSIVPSRGMGEAGRCALRPATAELAVRSGGSSRHRHDRTNVPLTSRWGSSATTSTSSTRASAGQGALTSRRGRPTTSPTPRGFVGGARSGFRTVASGDGWRGRRESRRHRTISPAFLGNNCSSPLPSSVLAARRHCRRRERLLVAKHTGETGLADLAERRRFPGRSALRPRACQRGGGRHAENHSRSSRGRPQNGRPFSP